MRNFFDKLISICILILFIYIIYLDYLYDVVALANDNGCHTSHHCCWQASDGDVIKK